MLTMTTIGALAPVKWTDQDGGEETVLFVIGDTEEELDAVANTILNIYQHERWLQVITVVEATHKEWWDIKHGTNINKGFYINNTSEIELIQDSSSSKVNN